MDEDFLISLMDLDDKGVDVEAIIEWLRYLTAVWEDSNMELSLAEFVSLHLNCDQYCDICYLEGDTGDTPEWWDEE